MADDDSFLTRWSRRKTDARASARQHDAAVAPPGDTMPGASPDAPPGASSGPRGTAGLAPVQAPAAQPPAAAAAKRAAQGTPPSAPADAAATAEAAAPPGEPVAAEPAIPTAPTLADVEALTRDSDYSRFVVGDVAPAVRNAALKKLFSDPHFNVMDGLDTYIDDYGKADPLTADMLRKMVQSRWLGLATEEDSPADAVHAAAGDVPTAQTDLAATTADRAGRAPTPGPGTGPSTGPSTDARTGPSVGPGAAGAPEDIPAHEDTHLQLQPVDAAGRPDARPGAGPDSGRER